MDVRNIENAPTFVTKDGSEIRELLAHRNSQITQQSLAEARLAVGARTTPHYHSSTEEIYYILGGQGRMQIEDESRDVGPGDAIAIPPRRHIRSKTLDRKSSSFSAAAPQAMSTTTQC